MKIRNDFVTNSSSSSFVVEIEVDANDNSRYVFETQPSESGANSNLTCSSSDFLNTSSIHDLSNLLIRSMTGTGKNKIKSLTDELESNIEEIGDIDKITLRRIWVSWGESSGMTIINDEQLHSLAKKIVSSVGHEQQEAINEFEEYLKNAEVYVEGGWQDHWPTGFCGEKAVPRYQWEYLDISSIDLAKKIVNGKIDHNDLAVETVVVNMQDKSVEEKAEFIIDSQEKGIGKKKAHKAGNFFANTIRIICCNYKVCENTPITTIIPSCNSDCDNIDFVVFEDQKVKFVILIKTTANSRSKSFKSTVQNCEAANIHCVILDEKKDISEDKVFVRINEAIYADIFSRYVVNNDCAEEMIMPISGEGYSVKVKFSDNRTYLYKCVGEINVGDVVYVGGSKAGYRGLVIAVQERMSAKKIEEATGIYSVERKLLL